MSKTFIAVIKDTLLIITLVVSSIGGFGQQAVSISKEEIVKKALQNNPSSILGGYDIVMAEADLEKANNSILPDINLSYTGISTNNALMAFGSRLNQERIQQADFNPALLNDPARIENFTSRIEVRQPILNFDIKYYREAAKAKLSATRLKSARTADDIILQVEQSYLQLQLAYKAMEVLEKSQRLAQENDNVAEDRYNQGYLQKSDLLAVKLRLNRLENQVIVANNNIQDISDHLLLLMDEKPGVLFYPADSLVMLDKLISPQEISTERNDLKAMRMVSDAYLMQNEGHQKSHLPRINGWASYEIHDNSPLTIDGEGYMIGIQLTWNLMGKKKNSSQAQRSRAEYEKSQVQYRQFLAYNNMELEKNKRLLNNALQNISLSQQALEQAEESLRIRSNRYRQGLELTSDILAAESTFAERQLDYYSAIFQYHNAVAYINYLTKK